jgi:hypothetical protein
LLEVESNLAARVSIYPPGVGAFVSSITGTMAAALAANSSVFAMRLDPGAAVNAYITRIWLEWATIVAFTTPVTAGRRLALYRGSGANASGGTALTAAAMADSTQTSEFSTAQGGDMRIATTAALTVTGITYEAQEFRTMHLTGFGAAGANRFVDWNAPSFGPLMVIRPGQLLAIRNPAAMDAAGTWQLAVGVEWREAAA